MKKQNKATECCDKSYLLKRHHHHHHCSSSDTIYGLGVVGALFYFLQSANSFSTVMIGIGKAIFWPAILLFKLLTNLQL